MYNQMIREICEELQINYILLSKDWIFKLEKDNVIRYIAGYKFDLNSHAAGLCIDDKYATYEALKSNNIPVIEHRILYDESNPEIYAKNDKSRSLAYDYFKNHNEDIVIKINTGFCGNDVYHIKKYEEIDPILDKLFLGNMTVSLCPFYKIKHEYRVIMLNGKPEIMYRKTNPIVVGNGHSLLSELLHEFNPNFNYQITKDYILKEGEEYAYSWKHNLSQGAKMDLEVPEKDIILDLAKKAVHTLNLNFGSVDVIETSEGYQILECNSGVMMENLMKTIPNGYNFAKEVYTKAIKSMFEME